MRHSKKITALLLCLAMLISIFALSGCGIFILGGGGEELTLDVPITEDDYTLFAERLAELRRETFGGAGLFKVMMLSVQLNEILSKIMHGKTAMEVKYYMDTTNEEALAASLLADDIYFRSRQEYMKYAQDLYNSDLEIKETFFEAWSESDIKILLANNDTTTALTEKNNLINKEFSAISNNERTPEWSATVNSMYSEYVNNYQLMAKEYGYDNYYLFASENVYLRDYTPEDRAVLRRYVAEYIIPLRNKVADKLLRLKTSLTAEDIALISEIDSTKCDETNPYLTSYINSYSDYSTRDAMSSLFDGHAFYSTSENALEGAFVTYSQMFYTPYAFFGKSCQDLMAVTHEMGHYISYLNGYSTYSIDIAEIQSQGNEFLLMYHIKDSISENAYTALFLTNLLGILSSISYATIVDEYEEAIYTAKTPYTPDMYESVMAEIVIRYPGIESFTNVRYTPFEYAQRVTLSNAVYYLSYATSGIAAIDFYITASTEGYSEAQSMYEALCFDINLENTTFKAVLSQASLSGPFDAQSYKNIEWLVDSIINPKKDDLAAA